MTGERGTVYETDDGWRWRVLDRDDVVIDEADEAAPDPATATAAIEARYPTLGVNIVDPPDADDEPPHPVAPEPD